jgi:hypothetical protein
MSGVPWPSITDEGLLGIWRAGDDELVGLIPAFMRLLVERLGPEALQSPGGVPYGYPFGHPDRTTYVDGAEQRYPEAPEAEALCAGRTPLLAIGANGSPTRLATKFFGLENRSALLTPGELEGADICALPFPVEYGSFPAGIAASPGTVVRCVVVDLVPEQIERLAVTEFGYHLARLTGTTLRAADGREISDPFAFVQRGGLYDVGDDTPAPLAAIPATGRRWPAWEQRDLVAHVAGRLGIPGADPDTLLSMVRADPGKWMGENASRLMGEATRNYEPAHEPYPLGAS